MAHAGGRPPKYEGQDTIDKVREYLNLCVDEEREIMNADKLTTRLKVNFPSIEKLAKYLHVNRSTLYQWEKDYPEFSDILDEVLQEQASRLLDNGLSGDYNSSITKLVLGKHNYHDRTDVTSGGEKLPTPMLLNLNDNNNSNTEDSEADE